MRLPFWLLAVLLALLLIAAWHLPRSVAQAAAGPWRPRAPCLPHAASRAFVVGATAMTTAYTHGALVLALGGQVAHDLVGSGNALASGAMLSAFALAAAAVTLLGKRLGARGAVALGAAASAAGMALLAGAVAWRTLALFLLVTTTSGAGYGLLVLDASQLVTQATPAARRGGVLSVLYLVAYFAMGVVALLIGTMATRWGLRPAVDLGAGAIGLLSLAVLGVVALIRR